MKAHYFDIAGLEAYQETVLTLASEFPDMWGLICRAEDRCRAEHFARLRRKAEADRVRGVVSDYDPVRPWNFCFAQAAADDKFWNREVRNPAIHVIAQTSKGAGHAGAAVEVAEAEADLSTGGTSKRAPKRARDMQKMAELEAEVKRLRLAGAPPVPAPPGKFGGGSSVSTAEGGRPEKKTQAGGHPRMRGELYATTRDGTEVCFAFGRGKCQAVCPNNRAHVCQLCLQAHPMQKCPQKKRAPVK